MQGMFNECSALTSLDLSSFDTSHVTDISYMFDGCYSLISLNLASFDTSNVVNRDLMFYKCSSLSKLSLGKSISIYGTSLPTASGANASKTWQNIGNGSEKKPEGSHSWTSDHFMKQYKGTLDSDTYVLFKERAEPLTMNYVDQDGKSITGVSPVTVAGYVFVSSDKEVTDSKCSSSK